MGPDLGTWVMMSRTSRGRGGDLAGQLGPVRGLLHTQIVVRFGGALQSYITTFGGGVAVATCVLSAGRVAIDSESCIACSNGPCTARVQVVVAGIAAWQSSSILNETHVSVDRLFYCRVP